VSLLLRIPILTALNIPPVTFSGKFEPPGAASLASYLTEYEHEFDPKWLAVKAATLRAEKAEKEAAQAPAGNAPRLVRDCHQHINMIVHPQLWPNPRALSVRFARAT
jgi:hypothetical protein